MKKITSNKTKHVLVRNELKNNTEFQLKVLLLLKVAFTMMNHKITSNFNCSIFL